MLPIPPTNPECAKLLSALGPDFLACPRSRRSPGRQMSHLSAGALAVSASVRVTTSASRSRRRTLSGTSLIECPELSQHIRPINDSSGVSTTHRLFQRSGRAFGAAYRAATTAPATAAMVTPLDSTRPGFLRFGRCARPGRAGRVCRDCRHMAGVAPFSRCGGCMSVPAAVGLPAVTCAVTFPGRGAVRRAASDRCSLRSRDRSSPLPQCRSCRSLPSRIGLDRIGSHTPLTFQGLVSSFARVSMWVSADSSWS